MSLLLTKFFRGDNDDLSRFDIKSEYREEKKMKNYEEDFEDEDENEDDENETDVGDIENENNTDNDISGLTPTIPVIPSISSLPTIPTIPINPINNGVNGIDDAGGEIKPQRCLTYDDILKAFVQHLKRNKIFLVCFDFDRTIIDPRYAIEFYDPVNIRNRISPLFVKLAILLLQNCIDVSIVTFNMNPMIQKTMALMGLPIKVFAREDSDLLTGKGWHLDNAMRFYNYRHGLDDKCGIHPANILFIDDDGINISIATRAGYQCIHNAHVIDFPDLIGYMNRDNVKLTS